MPSRGDDRRKRFWEIICGFSGALWLGFALTVSLLVLSLFSYVFASGETASYVILQIDLVLLTVALVGFSVLLYRCNRS